MPDPVVPVCNLCGHLLRPAKGSPTTGTILVGIVLILIGLGLTSTCWLSPVGIPVGIAGIIVCTIGRKGLRCTGCGQFVPRS